MSSFTCENIHGIHQGQVNDELCLTHRGILRTEESHRGILIRAEEMEAFSIDLCYKTSSR